MTKTTPSIEEAQELLRRAVEANKDELVVSLRKVRSQLDDLVAALGPNALPKEVKRELDALAQMRNEVSHGKSVSTYVRASEKIAWIREQLTQHNGEMPKVQLLESARSEWSGRNVSQQFLDASIDEAFETRKESDATVTVLLKGGATD
jgi:DNA repair photolyase